jgi:hypothetical protein
MGLETMSLSDSRFALDCNASGLVGNQTRASITGSSEVHGMNPMDVWNLITVDPTNFVREFRVWLHNVSFEIWMRYLGGVIALVGLAFQAKTLMIAADARAFVPVMLRVALVGALVGGQQPLRIAAEGWYGGLYRWGQSVIRLEATKASSTVTALSATLGLIGIGWAGYKAGAAMAASKGASLPEVTLAGKEGAVKMILGAGQFIFALLLPIYMAYYVAMLLAGVTITLGIAVLPLLAGLTLVPGVGGTSSLISATRAIVTAFFVMLLLPHIFNLCLSISWNEPARVVNQSLEAAWTQMVAAWDSYAVNLGVPGIDQAATVANLMISGDGFARVGTAVVTALLALIGGVAMILIGMFSSLYIVRRSESMVSQVIGGLAVGAAGAVGMGEYRPAAAFGGEVVQGAFTSSSRPPSAGNTGGSSSPVSVTRSRGGPGVP